MGVFFDGKPDLISFKIFLKNVWFIYFINKLHCVFLLIKLIMHVTCANLESQ